MTDPTPRDYFRTRLASISSEAAEYDYIDVLTWARYGFHTVRAAGYVALVKAVCCDDSVYNV